MINGVTDIRYCVGNEAAATPVGFSGMNRT